MKTNECLLQVFFLLAGVAVALAAPDRPVTSYGVPRVTPPPPCSYTKSRAPLRAPSPSTPPPNPCSPSLQDSDSFEHFRPSSRSFERSASFEHFRPSSSSRSFESYESDESTEAKYAFRWSVEDESTGNDFDHEEARDGDDTQGVYTVRLPDSRLQTVTYIVDGNDGYVADVKYDGVARFPDSYSRESFESASGSFERYAPPRRTYFAPGSNESNTVTLNTHSSRLPLTTSSLVTIALTPRNKTLPIAPRGTKETQAFRVSSPPAPKHYLNS
ncbi:hypothetical protein O3P69_015867 [Scylla paramamosain]|uniref:Pro-resilin n=1 Tax=Scylla paramamosain TaxID=85552 RepID=A0AAW0T7X4_SCYPA